MLNKFRALIVATLLGFSRNWKSVFLLLGIPFLLVLGIFVSFDTQGMQQLPVGIIQQTDLIDLFEYETTYLSYLELEKFTHESTCLSALKQHRVYMCLIVEGIDQIQVRVYYDNTREPIIWELLQRIRTSFTYMQTLMSTEIATSFFGEMDVIKQKVGYFDNSLTLSQEKLEDVADDLGDYSDEIVGTKTDLDQLLMQMESDINSASSELSDLDNAREELENDIDRALSDLDDIADDLPKNSSYANLRNQYSYTLTMLENNFNTQNRVVEQRIQSAQSDLSRYNSAHKAGVAKSDDLNNVLSDIWTAERELDAYQKELKNTQDELENIEGKIALAESYGIERLVSPLVTIFEPTYIPQQNDKTGERSVEQINTGLNMLALQTLYPSLLVMIVVFLSLMISSYICLQEVNSRVSARHSLIPGIFFIQFIATYVSSLIILFPPILIILLLGQFLFQLAIFQSITVLLLGLFFMVSSFIFIGMFLSYLVKKESLTLLIATLLLVFFIFFTGLIFPLERMTQFGYTLGIFLPSHMILSIFKISVFYDQLPGETYLRLVGLSLWFFWSAVAAIVAKLFRGATK